MATFAGCHCTIPCMETIASKLLSYITFIWINYEIALTWIKAIWGWFPLLTMIPVRSRWGRYNLPRFINFLLLFTPTQSSCRVWTFVKKMKVSGARRFSSRSLRHGVLGVQGCWSIIFSIWGHILLSSRVYMASTRCPRVTGLDMCCSLRAIERPNIQTIFTAKTLTCKFWSSRIDFVSLPAFCSKPH